MKALLVARKLLIEVTREPQLLLLELILRKSFSVFAGKNLICSENRPKLLSVKNVVDLLAWMGLASAKNLKKSDFFLDLPLGF